MVGAATGRQPMVAQLRSTSLEGAFAGETWICGEKCILGVIDRTFSRECEGWRVDWLDQNSLQGSVAIGPVKTVLSDAVGLVARGSISATLAGEVTRAVTPCHGKRAKWKNDLTLSAEEAFEATVRIDTAEGGSIEIVPDRIEPDSIMMRVGSTGIPLGPQDVKVEFAELLAPLFRVTVDSPWVQEGTIAYHGGLNEPLASYTLTVLASKARALAGGYAVDYKILMKVQ